jgi:hypothetical protein
MQCLAALVISLLPVVVAVDDGRQAIGTVVGMHRTDPFELNRRYEALKALDAAGLAKQLADDRAEHRPMLRNTERGIDAAARLWALNADPEFASVALRALRASLAPYAGRSPQELASMVSQRGAADPSNPDMRDACRHLAMLRAMTGDRESGAAAVAILAAFAQAIPAWPLWLPYDAPMEKRTAHPQGSPVPYKDWQCSGLWGDWMYFDLEDAVPLAQAWRILKACGDLSDGETDAAIRRMLELHVTVQRRFSTTPMYSNMDDYQIRGQMDFGLLLGDPALVHAGVRQFVNLYRTSFYADGWWHEGAASYHDNLQRGLSDIAKSMLPDYSDPPGWSDTVEPRRFDKLDLAKLVQFPSQRADRVLHDVTLPDGNYRAVHDTVWPHASRFTSGAPNGSVLFGCTGEGTLVTRPGTYETSVSLHFGGTGGHAHLDALNLQVWSKGVEAISETQYYPIAGSESTREWHTMTAGHATVVVNERDQGATGRRVRTPQPLDAIEGIPDWPWRWTRCCNVDQGTLRMFSRSFPEVQVVEADAEASYDSVANVDLYRRTVALVRIDGRDDYIVDIFRVQGGHVHDFMLHSCLQEPVEVQTAVALAPMPGKLHKYITSLQAAKLDEGARVDFVIGKKAVLHSYVCPMPGAQLIVGEAPAMRVPGMAPFVTVRHAGNESSFVVVHHVASGGDSRIRSVTLLPCAEAGTVALSVDLGFRKDTVISRRDRSVSPVKVGEVETSAMFSHVATMDGGAGSWAFMSDGDLLATPWCSIRGSVSHEGNVLSATRREAGDRFDGFTVSPAIPSGCSVAGETMVVAPADLAKWAYPVIEHASKDGMSFVALDADPGLRVTPGQVKQQCYPGFGAAGATTFRIPGSAALIRAGDGSWEYRNSGAARAFGADGTGIKTR